MWLNCRRGYFMALERMAFQPTKPSAFGRATVGLGATRDIRRAEAAGLLWVELCRPTDVGQMTAVGATADKSFGSSAQSPVSRHRVRQFPTLAAASAGIRGSAQDQMRLPKRGESRRHRKATTKRNARIGRLTRLDSRDLDGAEKA